MTFSKKAISSPNPPLHLRAARGAGAPDARRVHQPLHAHRHRPHGALWNPREHHHGAGNPRIRLRQQPAVDEVEQPLRHQVQAQLDGRQGLPRRRRRQGRMLPLPTPRSRRRTGTTPNSSTRSPATTRCSPTPPTTTRAGRGVSRPRATPRPPTTRSGSSASSRRTSSTCSTVPTACASTPRATA